MGAQRLRLTQLGCLVVFLLAFLAIPEAQAIADTYGDGAKDDDAATGSVDNTGTDLAVTVTRETRADGSVATVWEAPGRALTPRELADALLSCKVANDDLARSQSADVLLEAGCPGAPSAGGGVTQVSAPTSATSTDFASIAPGPAAFMLEPNGWTIVGGNMNAYASAGPVTRQTTLVGFPVTVTFEPVAYHWDWGDGTTSTTETGGASWESSRLADWSQTATSHVYAEKGQRTVSLVVEYRPSATLNGRPLPVTGTTRGAAHTASVLVVESDRALVAHNCLEAPNDPGCQ